MRVACSAELCTNNAPEAVQVAANAMVNVARLILVILICVLLVKLRQPRNQIGRAGRGRYREAEEEEEEQDTHASSRHKMESGRELLEANRSKGVKLISSSQNGRQESLFDFRLITNLISSSSKSFGKTTEKIRRISEPEMGASNNFSTSQQQHHQQLIERRRRHSDSTLAHLKLPPGPIGLPFLGYLPFVGHEIHLTLTSLSQKYGPIYQIYLGAIRVVVLNDASLVRQAFKQPVFSGRPDTQLTRILQGYGIVNSDGALWKEQRAFLHTALRKLGAKSLMNGSNGLEAKIQNQVKEFVNDLSVNVSEGKPCQVRPFVARAVSSVVGSIVMNSTYRKYEEKEKFDRLIELMQEGFRLFTIAMPLDFIPIFRFLPGISYAYKKMKKNRAETSAFFQGVADEHRKYLNETFNLSTPSSASSLHPKSNSDSQARTLADSQRQQPQPQQQLDGQQPQQPMQLPEQPQQVLEGQGNNCQSAALRNVVVLGGKDEAKVAILVKSELPKQAPVLEEGEREEAKDKKIELEHIVTRDLVDAYIVQQKKHETDGKENYFSDQQLVQIMSDIFSAGLETVTSTIEWSILFLILNPECQEQIQQEIDKIIGRSRMPQLDDLSQMPYTEATIYEVLRRSNVVALGNAHATLDDASIGGYKIPKGTQVLPNLYGIHMNPKLWQEPDKFDPMRFIVNDKAYKPDYFIPFSVGRRMCLGDVLAKMEVFLFLIGLLQKYDLSVAEEDRHCPPQVKGTIGVSNTPASFRVAIKLRAGGPSAEFAPKRASTTQPPPTLGGAGAENLMPTSVQ